MHKLASIRLCVAILNFSGELMYDTMTTTIILGYMMNIDCIIICKHKFFQATTAKHWVTYTHNYAWAHVTVPVTDFTKYGSNKVPKQGTLLSMHGHSCTMSTVLYMYMYVRDLLMPLFCTCSNNNSIIIYTQWEHMNCTESIHKLKRKNAMYV